MDTFKQYLKSHAERDDEMLLHLASECYKEGNLAAMVETAKAKQVGRVCFDEANILRRYWKRMLESAAAGRGPESIRQILTEGAEEIRKHVAYKREALERLGIKRRRENEGSSEECKKERI